MAEIGEITARLTADVQSFTDGMARAGTSVQQFQAATATATSGTKTFYEGVAQAGEFATGSERGVRRMEFALGAMSAEAVGASHGLGTLIEGLLLFSGGSVVVIGVLGAIAAVAGAIKLMGLEAAASQKAFDEMVKSLDKLGPHAKLVADQLLLMQLYQKQAQEQMTAQGPMGAFSDFFEQWRVLLGGTPIDAQIATQRMKVNQDAKELQDILDQQADKQNEQRLTMDEFIERTTRMLDLDTQRLDKLDETKHLVAGLNEAYAQTLAITQGPVAAGIFRASMGAGDIDIKDIDKEAARALEGIQRELDKDMRESERQAQEWGRRITAGLIDGLTGNLKALEGVMKSAIEAFIQKNVITPFLVGLGIFSPSEFGAYVGTMVVAGVQKGFQTANLGPLGLNMSLNVSKSGNLSPFDLARDSDWQQAYRETSLVAHQGGFRLPGQT